RRPAGRRLERGQAEGLAVRGDDTDRGQAQVAGQRRLIDGTDETNLAGNAEGGRQRFEARALATARAALARTVVAVVADDQQHGRFGPRSVPRQNRHGADDSFGALEPLEAPRKDDDLGVAQAEALPKRRGGPFVEDLQVHAGGHDAEPGPGGAIEANQVIGFLRARGDQPVAMPDDRLLDRDPMLRLHQRPFGGAFVFHAGQGVEGVEPGHVPLVAQAAGYPPREPVVAVDQAIAAAAATLLAQDGFAEVGKQIEEARLIDVVRGSNGEARDPALLGQPDPVPPVRARPAGEDFGRDAATAELFADRPDVDVHPAVFARPEGGDGR